MIIVAIISHQQGGEEGRVEVEVEANYNKAQSVRPDVDMRIKFIHTFPARERQKH